MLSFGLAALHPLTLTFLSTKPVQGEVVEGEHGAEGEGEGGGEGKGKGVEGEHDGKGNEGEHNEAVVPVS